MRLTIMIALYAAAILAAVGVLFGPLRRAVDPERKHPLRVAVPILIVLIMGAFPVIGAVTPDGPLCWFFQKWGNIFLGIFIYFFGPLLILSLCLLIYGLIYRAKRHERWRPGRTISAAVLAVSLIATAVLNVSGWNTAHDVKVTGYQLPKEMLGLDEPMRIVLISDLHIGVNSGTELYREMVEKVNEQDADLVVVTGDLITSSYGAMRHPEEYAAIFSEIRSRYGAYAVYGNHDVDEPLLGGFTYIEKEKALRNPAMESWVRSCGWQLLEDEVTEVPGIDGMLLAGRRDESKPGDSIDERLPLKELLRDTDPDKKVLLLQHEPTDLRELGEDGVALSLSGHTHDGQIFPGNIYCRIFTRQSYGIKDWGDAKAIVTSGVGYYGPPLRVGTISEIVVIDLN